MKRSRPLALFLSVILLITCFSVSVSAESSENLIDSDLTTWTDLQGTTLTREVNHYGYYYQVSFVPRSTETSSGNTVYVNAGAIFDLTNITAGNTYKLSFYLCDYDDTGLPPEVCEDGLEYGSLFIGLASYSSSSESTVLFENCFIVIDSENYSDYFGKTNSISFEAPNVVNPCIVIGYLGAGYDRNLYFGFKDVTFTNETQAEEDGFFDRLFQFFHDLKWEIVGGACGDSDCNKNPHTSLADKITNKVEELKKSFTDLRDSIDGFLDDFFDKIADFLGGFGNLILYFNWEGDYTNPFEREDSPIDKVSEFFDNLIEYVGSIGTSIENVLDSITGGLHIFDEFTSRFPWLKGIAIFCLALIVVTRFIGL